MICKITPTVKINPATAMLAEVIGSRRMRGLKIAGIKLNSPTIKITSNAKAALFPHLYYR
jgi:hypothetical protein